MSRLHRQKLRLRSQQRADGLIEPEARQVDRDAFQEVGTTHAGAKAALELVERHGADREPPPAAQIGQAGQAGQAEDVLRGLSPVELEEVRAHIARTRAQAAAREHRERQAGPGGAQNPPL